MNKKQLFAAFLLFFCACPASSFASDSTRVPAEEKSPQELYLDTYVLIKGRFNRPTTDDGRALRKWQTKYRDMLLNQEDADVAIRSLIASLADPMTRIVADDDIAASARDSDVTGIGISLGSVHARQLMVFDVFANSPASRAGIKRGWTITRIDDKQATELTVNEAVRLLRGTVGTPVTVSFSHDSKKQTFTIERAKIALESVSYAGMLQQDIGYIRIENLSRSCCDAVRTALSQLSSSKALIIDLRSIRSSFGMKNACEVASLFVKGVIAVRIDRDEYRSEISSNSEPIYNKPIAVLVNKGTSQYAELLSAALRDSANAVLIGEATQGIGVEQETYQLENGKRLDITCNRLRTPHNNSYEGTGLIPEIRVRPDIRKSQEPWFYGKNVSFFDHNGQVQFLDDQKEPTMQDVQLETAIEFLKKRDNP